TMQAPVLVKAGTDTYFGTRAGDYSGITVDPVTGTSFWAANEYARFFLSYWGTWIANFSLSAPPPPSAPHINSLSDSPDPSKRGGTLTLTANSVTGTVSSVSFYRDGNGNGTLDVGTDLLLGTDTNGANGWSVSVSIPSTFPLGTYTYFAQASGSLG